MHHLLKKAALPMSNIHHQCYCMTLNAFFQAFFNFFTFDEMYQKQLLAKKQVALVLMVLLGFFHLYRLENILCGFTDVKFLVCYIILQPGYYAALY